MLAAPDPGDDRCYVALGRRRSHALSGAACTFLASFVFFVGAAVVTTTFTRASIVKLRATSASSRAVDATSVSVVVPKAKPERRLFSHKYSVEYVTPRQLQLLRGACWLFSIDAVLEHSYRKQGVESGFLPASQYLKLSPQAIGAVMTHACAAHHPACETGDDDLAYSGHTTEGGEAEWLYYLQRFVGDTVALPETACPYVPTPTEDDSCAGKVYEPAQFESSPLSFRIKSLRTMYDLEEMKASLRETGRAHAFSLALFGQDFLLPCSKEHAGALSCDPDGGPECRPCPIEPNFADVKCCVQQSRFGTNMRGEFSASRPGEALTPAGGHAVTLVGFGRRPLVCCVTVRCAGRASFTYHRCALVFLRFTDTYVSSLGHVGGLIIKNSWWDGIPLKGMRRALSRARPAHACDHLVTIPLPTPTHPHPPSGSCADPTAPCAAGRGSHSLAYFMSQHSDPEEREICPNVHSPASWYMCKEAKSCASEGTATSARAMRKVLRLQCLDDGDRSPYVEAQCKKGERFFLKNVTRFGGGLSVACMLRAAGGTDLCLPPLWLEDLALLFEPIEEEKKENDPDQCGFYLLPYAVYREVASTFGATWASDLEVEWDPASFAGAPHSSRRGAGKDYGPLEKNTFEQRASTFTGPFPDLNKVL